MQAGRELPLLANQGTRDRRQRRCIRACLQHPICRQECERGPGRGSLDAFVFAVPDHSIVAVPAPCPRPVAPIIYDGATRRLTPVDQFIHRPALSKCRFKVSKGCAIVRRHVNCGTRKVPNFRVGPGAKHDNRELLCAFARTHDAERRCFYASKFMGRRTSIALNRLTD